MSSHEEMKKKRRKIKERTFDLSRFFGGLTGRAADALRNRRSKLDEAIDGKRRKK